MQDLEEDDDDDDAVDDDLLFLLIMLVFWLLLSFSRNEGDVDDEDAAEDDDFVEEDDESDYSEESEYSDSDVDPDDLSDEGLSWGEMEKEMANEDKENLFMENKIETNHQVDKKHGVSVNSLQK